MQQFCSKLLLLNVALVCNWNYIIWYFFGKYFSIPLQKPKKGVYRVNFWIAWVDHILGYCSQPKRYIKACKYYENREIWTFSEGGKTKKKSAFWPGRFILPKKLKCRTPGKSNFRPITQCLLESTRKKLCQDDVLRTGCRKSNARKDCVIVVIMCEVLRPLGVSVRVNVDWWPVQNLPTGKVRNEWYKMLLIAFQWMLIYVLSSPDPEMENWALTLNNCVLKYVNRVL